MHVGFDMSEDIARHFAAEPGGIGRAALEAFAVEGVRSGRLTAYQARQMLGIRRNGTLTANSSQKTVNGAGDSVNRLAAVSAVPYK